MKTYDIRPPDLQSIFITFWEHEERQARKCYEESFKNAPETDLRHGAVLCLSEWESPEEADKDRLDWFESRPSKSEVKGGAEDGHTGKVWAVAAAVGTLRETLDVLRAKPKDKVTVIDRPAGSK